MLHRFNGILNKSIIKKPNILIYFGKGTSLFSVFSLYKQLRKLIDLKSANVKVVTSTFIKNQDWESNTKLIIIPGGRSKPYYTSLDTHGNQKIYNYVANGGKYLGICAGAYYGCAYTEFEKNTRLEISLEGPLNFFKGKAIGPVYGVGQFKYRSFAGAKLAQITWGSFDSLAKPTGCIYYNGGCTFSPTDSFSETKVLARYSDLMDSPPAIIESTVGTGKAILSGVHFESCANVMRMIPFSRKEILTELNKFKGYHESIFNKVLTRFEIKLASFANTNLQTNTTIKENTMKITKKVHFEITDSTQTQAKNQINTLIPNECILFSAEEQTAGRGTRERKWVSPPKVNFYGTYAYLLPTNSGTPIQNIPQIAAYSVFEVFQQYGLTPSIKWINDVLLNGKKACGILAETMGLQREQEHYTAFFIGVGVNLNMTVEDIKAEQAEALQVEVTSMKMSTGQNYDKNEFEEKLNIALMKNLNLFHANGFEPFYQKISVVLEKYQGKEQYVDLTDNVENHQIIKGRIIGINETGNVILDVNGKTYVPNYARILKDKEIEIALKEMSSSTKLSTSIQTIVANNSPIHTLPKQKQKPLLDEKPSIENIATNKL